MLGVCVSFKFSFSTAVFWASTFYWPTLESDLTDSFRKYFCFYYLFSRNSFVLFCFQQQLFSLSLSASCFIIYIALIWLSPFWIACSLDANKLVHFLSEKTLLIPFTLSLLLLLLLCPNESPVSGRKNCSKPSLADLSVSCLQAWLLIYYLCCRIYYYHYYFIPIGLLLRLHFFAWFLLLLLLLMLASI